MTLRAAILALALLCQSSIAPCMAQAVQTELHTTADASAKKEVPASLVHSGLKTVTLKLVSMVLSAGMFYGGTGSVADAGMLSVISAVGSSGLFAANDYLWDYFYPNTNISVNGEKFDAAASAWRNTLKYVTVKPALISFGYGVVYLYTGSVAQTVALGTASIFVFPVAFYANNMTWDWYDWYAASGVRAGRFNAEARRRGEGF